MKLGRNVRFYYFVILLSGKFGCLATSFSNGHPSNIEPAVLTFLTSQLLKSQSIAVSRNIACIALTLRTFQPLRF